MKPGEREDFSTVRNENDSVSNKEQKKHDEAFTLSVCIIILVFYSVLYIDFLQFDYDTTFRAHKVAPVASSFDGILRKVYHYSLFGTYNVVVFLVGICLVVFWGIMNAITIFSQTWCLSPIVRYCLVSMQFGVYPFYEISHNLFKCTNELCRTLGTGCCRRKDA